MPADPHSVRLIIYIMVRFWNRGVRERRGSPDNRPMRASTSRGRSTDGRLRATRSEPTGSAGSRRPWRGGPSGQHTAARLPLKASSSATSRCPSRNPPGERPPRPPPAIGASTSDTSGEPPRHPSMHPPSGSCEAGHPSVPGFGHRQVRFAAHGRAALPQPPPDSHPDRIVAQATTPIRVSTERRIRTGEAPGVGDLEHRGRFPRRRSAAGGA